MAEQPIGAIFKHPFRSSVSSDRPLSCLIVRILFSTHDTRSRAERIIRTLRGIASCAFYLHERWDRFLREGVGVRIELGSFASTLVRRITHSFATFALVGAEGVSFVHQASFRV
eukprot:scaffold846_cov336-Pavlova_lutheri.AAC.12